MSLKIISIILAYFFLTSSICESVKVLVTQLCPTLCQPHGLQPTRLLCPWGFSRQEYWSGQPFVFSRVHPHPGIEPASPELSYLGNAGVSHIPGWAQTTSLSVNSQMCWLCHRDRQIYIYIYMKSVSRQKEAYKNYS